MPSISNPRGADAAHAPRAQLDALYRGHAEWLGTILRRRYGKQLCSEDLVQETYIRAARLSAGDAVRHPRALLLRIAERLASDQLRRLRRAEQTRALTLPQGSSAPTQAETVLLGELVAGLPQTCRDTFLLSRVAGLPYEEIARRQGVSVKAIEWRMSRALELLARRLAE